MKNWKIVLLILGVLLILISFVVYSRKISTCYPAEAVWERFTPEHQASLSQSCQLNAISIVRFIDFLIWFVPGSVFFTAYWLSNRPVVKHRRGTQLSFFLLFIMFDCLLITGYSLISYPVPGVALLPAGWVVETIAALSFLSYLATLALWNWKRWGLIVFQAASIALAIFILLGSRSLVLSGVIIAGVLGLSLLFRPVHNKLV